MKHQQHRLLLSLTGYFAFLSTLFPSYSTSNDLYIKCSNARFHCGNIQGIGYPFWGLNVPEFCGHHSFHLDCLHDQYPLIVISGEMFLVLTINQEILGMKIVRWDLWQDACYPDQQDIILQQSCFSYTKTFRNFTLLYGCPALDGMERYNFSCDSSSQAGATSVYNFYADEVTRAIQKPEVNSCGFHLSTPVSEAALMELYSGSKTLDEALREGFDVEYHAHWHACLNCQESDGICGSNLSTHNFRCFRKIQATVNDNSSSSSPSIINGQISNSRKVLKGIIIGFALAGTLLSSMIVFSFWSMRRMIASNQMAIPFWRGRTSKSCQDIELVIKQSIALKRFSYSDVKKMTDSFKNKLGQGGYGTVYKGGLLEDGRPVAVKILIDKLQGKGEEFINEVASISRTSHVNIVSLLGFCLEGSKKALIYEFMVNGSLEKFLYNGNSSADCCLGWETLYQIAIGIARGLEYLHRGCNTRILHFDIKPHNILLDECFRPKISDFGLSKLCFKEESITLMDPGRGTIGYIAPEVYSGSFGRVSHKSDVYSYGMMILEMVSGRNNANVRAEHASKIYFPHWIYQRLLLDIDLGLYCVRTKEEDEIARKLALVGLWCIQTNPSHRPSMSEILVILETCSEALETPPKPFNVSPQSSGSNPSATSV